MKQAMKLTIISVVLILSVLGCDEKGAPGKTSGGDARLYYGAVNPEMEIPPAGAVKPRGWLLDMARVQRDGHTGRMDEIDVQFKRAWRADMKPRGRELAWNVEPGAWSFEGGAYWFDGLTRLCRQIDDEALVEMASNRLDNVLERITEKSIGICWWMDRDNPSDRAEIAKDNWLIWVAGIAERAIGTWYETTRDERARRALVNAFDSDVFSFRAYATTPSAAYDAYRLTGDKAVAAALDSFFGRLSKEKNTFPGEFRQYVSPPNEYLDETLMIKRRHQWALGIPTRHGVIASESLLSVFRGYLWTGNVAWLDAVRKWYAFFDGKMRQPYGVTVMDEEWGYPGPKRGTETCVVAAESWTRINLLAALGEGSWGDDVEKAFFNAAPNCASADFRRHVYMQQPNRTEANDLSDCSFSGDAGEYLGRFDSKHWPLCCTAALNRILPDYVQSMWMTTRDGGVAAALYGPCSFGVELASGRFSVVEETSYPFDETLVLRLCEVPDDVMPLHLRIPSWCGKAEISLNGSPVDPVVKRGFAVVSRKWSAGDVVRLRFPMTVEVGRQDDYMDTRKSYRYITRGPLLFAKALDCTDDNTPVGDVSVPFLSDDVGSTITLEKRPMPDVWRWTPECAPVKLTIQDAAGKAQELVPYGCAKMRISMFDAKR